MGIENPSCMNVAIQVAQQPFQQSRFSRSRFARHNDEAFAGCDAVTKRRKRFVIAGVGKEKPRVRRHIERRLRKSKVFVVHDFYPRGTSFSRGADKLIEPIKKSVFFVHVTADAFTLHGTYLEILATPSNQLNSCPG